jgi:hypothetical protein
MKRFFTFLVFTILVSSVFAAAPVKVLYLGSADPGTAGDTIMPGYLTDMGLDVTYEVISDVSAVADYDAVVISETVGSSHTGWARYQTAPMPLVTFKVHATKTAALNWVATGAGVTGTDYDNGLDSIITVKQKTHPIFTGFEDTEIQVLENVGAIGALVGFVTLTDISGINVIAQSGVTDEFRQAIVCIDAGTVMNATVTMANKAVMIGWHQAAWPVINEDGLTIIKHAIKWAAGKPITSIADNSVVNTSLYPNPSTGLVNLNFSQNISNATVNVLSIDGKVVFSQQLTNTQMQQLDLSELHSGMYLINVEGSNVSFTDRLILN